MKPLYGQPRYIAQQALKLYSKELMANPNVEGLGLGLIQSRSVESQDEAYTVKVYVRRKPSFLRIFGFLRRFRSSEQSIPSVLSLHPDQEPRQLVQISTEIEEIGKVRLEAV